MNALLQTSIKEKLGLFDQQIRERVFLATFGYSVGLAGALGLYAFFPFHLSRVGSVVMIIALAHMIWKIHQVTDPLSSEEGAAEQPLLQNLGKLDAQIQLIQSLIYNLPFLTGANLFWMGLPGTGSAVTKAWLDCWFLLATVLLFGGCYLANQQTVRRQLLPLRDELKTCVLVHDESPVTKH